MLIDTWTGLRASPACSDYVEEMEVMNVNDSWAKKWILKNQEGKNWAEDMGFQKPITFAPNRECSSQDPRPYIAFLNPRENETIETNPLEIFGYADASDWFDFVRLDFGIGHDPDEWETLAKGNERLEEPELLYQWDLEDIPDGEVTLRIYMHSTEDTYAEKLLHLNLQVPTPTPSPTPTFTPTPTYTPTSTPTSTPTPTATPTNTQEPSPTTTTTTPPTNTPIFIIKPTEIRPTAES